MMNHSVTQLALKMRPYNSTAWKEEIFGPVLAIRCQKMTKDSTKIADSVFANRCQPLVFRLVFRGRMLQPARSFSTEEEAVHLANDTPYGLANAVCSTVFEQNQGILTSVVSTN